MDKKDVHIEQDEWIYQGFIKLKKLQLKYRQFSGGMSSSVSRELIVRAKVVGVLAFDPLLDKVVLLEQFRPGALESENPWLVEIVAGIQQNNESLDELALKELYEETGLKTTDLIPIYEYWVSPGACNEKVYLYCAKVDASAAEGIYGLATEHEDIRVFTVSSEEAFDMLAKGKISNSLTLIALQWLQLNKKKLLEKWQ